MRVRDVMLEMYVNAILYATTIYNISWETLKYFAYIHKKLRFKTNVFIFLFLLIYSLNNILFLPTESVIIWKIILLDFDQLLSVMSVFFFTLCTSMHALSGI